MGVFALNQAHGSNDFKTIFAGGFDGLHRGGSDVYKRQIQTVEAWNHGVHRNFTDVIAFLVIGVVLLVLLPAKREAVAPGVA